MSADHVPSHDSSVALQADRAQADYFRAELNSQIESLDHQIAVYQQALQNNGIRRDPAQVSHTRRALHRATMDRAAVVRMLHGLNSRFPIQ